HSSLLTSAALLAYTPSVFLFFFFLLIRCPPTSSLFPYTTLFRSAPCAGSRRSQVRRAVRGSPCTRTESRPCRASSGAPRSTGCRSEEHTSELQSLTNLVCRLLLEKKK